MNRALIVPSMYAGPDDHWYPDLRERLGVAGFTDVRTAAPPAEEPHLQAWLTAIKAACDRPDENTVVVGHSLGAVAALAFLSLLPGLGRVGRFVSVAGFAEPLPGLPTTAEFTAALDHTRLRDLVADRHMVCSRDDTAVPPALTIAAAELIRARVHEVDGAGHFLASNGWTRAGLPAELAVSPRGRSARMVP